MPAHSVNASVQDAAGDGDVVEAGGEKRLAAQEGRICLEYHGVTE